MIVQIKDKLSNSLNPDKRITGKIGEVIRKLPDGYWLIEFSDILIVRKRKTEFLQWYVHETDLITIK